MQDKAVRYIHTEQIHNYRAAEQVVPFLMQLLNPGSVVDVGCGTGTWLKVFADNGAKEILGIDGSYVDLSQLHIPTDSFQEYDLEKSYVSDRKFDVAISLEVAEHLKPQSAQVFVKTLTGLSEVVIFSAALPGQGGQNHLNEQPPGYWVELFKNEGFEVFDILRPEFWDNANVDFWYRQNMMLFTRNVQFGNRLRTFPDFFCRHLVHPELLGLRQKSMRNYQEIISGRKNLEFYLKLIYSHLRKKW